MRIHRFVVVPLYSANLCSLSAATGSSGSTQD